MIFMKGYFTNLCITDGMEMGDILIYLKIKFESLCYSEKNNNLK